MRIGGVPRVRFVRCIEGGSTEAESKRCDVEDNARTVGGEGCVCNGSSNRDCLGEYVCTEFWRDVVKNKFLASLAYFTQRTRPCSC